MPTPADLHRLALSLPEAVEGDDHGKPAYLVGKKIYCTVGEGGRATVRLDPEDQHNLAAPGAVEPAPGFRGRKGWTFLWLDQVREDQLALLLRLAWTGVAPKRLRG
jgi:hypothetical protein